METMQKKIRTAIVGVGGYTGLELLKLLINHPYFELSGVYATEASEDISLLHPCLKNVFKLEVEEANIQKIASNCELVFLALPHQSAMEYVSVFYEKGIKIVDLSADYRLEANTYEDHYCKHLDKDNIKNAVYGLPEYNRSLIQKTNLIANPGCYPTATLLGLLPFIPYICQNQTIFIDAKSGVSGAGKKLSQNSHFVTINENIFAYSPIQHRHAPEIKEQILKISNIAHKIMFVPHLLPLTRGMLVSIYCTLKEEKEPLQVLKEAYKNEPFIRIKNQCVQIKNVAGTHFCDIFAKSDGTNLFISSSIDNLLRGASSQALANANLMFQLEEHLGLPKIAYAP